MKSVVRTTTAIIVVCALVVVVDAQNGLDPRPIDLDTILERVGDYVSAYEQQLVRIIGEEEYVQNAVWREARRGTIDQREQRRLSSDRLLLRAKGRWFGVRIVLRVDDVPIEDREIFASDIIDSPASLIAAWPDNVRYNIGDFERTFNVPTYALTLLRRINRRRFTFEQGSEEMLGDRNTREVRFSEVVSPTLVQGLNGEDRHARGRLWVDPETGEILKTEIAFEMDKDGKLSRATVTVFYTFSPQLEYVGPCHHGGTLRERMIIENQEQVTEAVLSELQRADDPRFREIMSAAVRHLHAFAREVKLTELEFRKGCAVIAELGQRTNQTHNEVVLLSGSLGFSILVCLLNNGNKGQTETTANVLGPFWRMDSPPTKNGSSIIRSPTPGPALFVSAWVKDTDQKPVADAQVDVWHSSTEGFYESQDPDQADMNLRGKFTTDQDGYFSFRSVKPAGYPIPVDGPVGDLIRAQRRHNMRPAHLHFLIYKDGYKTHISQVYVNDDKNLETDVQFGVTRTLVGNYVRHENETSPGADVEGAWYSLDYTFTIEPGVAELPRPPITEKAEGGRPQLEILERA